MTRRSKEKRRQSFTERVPNTSAAFLPLDSRATPRHNCNVCFAQKLPRGAKRCGDFLRPKGKQEMTVRVCSESGQEGTFKRTRTDSSPSKLYENAPIVWPAQLPSPQYFHAAAQSLFLLACSGTPRTQHSCMFIPLPRKPPGAAFKPRVPSSLGGKRLEFGSRRPLFPKCLPTSATMSKKASR